LTGGVGLAHCGYPIPPYVIETEKKVPQGTVALKERARVLSVDGDRVRNIETILADVKTVRTAIDLDQYHDALIYSLACVLFDRATFAE
jgi:hypothetical protein